MPDYYGEDILIKTDKRPLKYEEPVSVTMGQSENEDRVYKVFMVNCSTKNHYVIYEDWADR